MCREHKERPGAREALQHPWLQGTVGDQDGGKPISQAIVQRLQVSPRAPQHCSKHDRLLETAGTWCAGRGGAFPWKPGVACFALHIAQRIVEARRWLFSRDVFSRLFSPSLLKPVDNMTHVRGSSGEGWLLCHVIFPVEGVIFPVKSE